jgi:hypothetical protein
MCDYAERYLRTNMRVALVNAVLTTSSQQILPMNPMRHAIIMPYSGANPMFYEFGDAVSGIGVNGYQGNSPQSHLTRDELGDVITFPLKLWMGTAGTTLRFEEISYDATHFANYMRGLNEWIANNCTW